MTQTRRTFLLTSLTAGLLLAGCSGGGIGGNKWQTNYADVVDPAVSKTWRVSQIDVQVPTTLTVSEENSYAPDADIVWRGEPRGDRYEQTRKIIGEAAATGSAGLRGSRPVRLAITVTRFHALTEKTRYTLEKTGVHNIAFTAQVFDARTGAPLTPLDPILAELIAYSGQEAFDAEARGETQRVRIVDHVSKVIAGWLGTGPDVRDSFSRRGR